MAQQRTHSWLRLFVFLLLCGALLVIGYRWAEIPLSVPPFLLLGFFALLNVIGTVMEGTARDPKQALRISMLAMAVKMFFALIVLVLILFLSSRENVLPMALTFMGLYLAFLIFGAVEQFRAVRQHPGNVAT